MQAQGELIQQSFGVQTFRPRNPETWEAVLPRFRRLCEGGMLTG